MSVSKNLEEIQNSIPKNVALIAVSKTKPVSDILEVYNAGHKAFGENKIQEMVEKYNLLPKDIEWHMIGHLQRNKVKYMAGFVHLIHGVDSLKTLQEINKQAIKHQRVINCLLQIKIAKEDTKFGVSVSDAEKLINSEDFKALKNIYIQGFMGMASFTNNQQIIQQEFKTLKTAFEKLKKHKTKNIEPTILSMGMSSDYNIAIEDGSTMTRVGSSIFGLRNYS